MLLCKIKNSSMAFPLNRFLLCFSFLTEKAQFGTDKLHQSSIEMPNPHNPLLDMLLTFLCLIIYSIISRTQGTLIAYSVYISSVKKSNSVSSQKYPFILSASNLPKTLRFSSPRKLAKVYERECRGSLSTKVYLSFFSEVSIKNHLYHTSHLNHCSFNPLQNIEFLWQNFLWISVPKAFPRKFLVCHKELVKGTKIFLNAKPKQSSLTHFTMTSKKMPPRDVSKQTTKRHSQLVSAFTVTPGTLPSRTSFSKEKKKATQINTPSKMDNEQVLVGFNDVVSDIDFENLLRTKRQAIDTALETALPLDKGIYPTATILNEAMRYTLLSEAKRVRPIGCIFACEALGGTQEKCMPTAVAIEMIHSMSLIHDDLPAMDNDCLRRGKATNHLIFGEDISILAGDALLAAAYTHVAKHSKDVPSDRIVEVIRRLGESAGIDGIAGGQSLDLRREGATNVTAEELQWIHNRKTGSLLKVSVSTGAVIAGAKKKEIERMETFAEKIGLAFQVYDDILDVTQSSFMLGKTAGKDAVTKKLSYPRLFGLEESKKIVKRLIQEAIDELSPFRERALPLIKLAHYISSRSN